MKLTRTVALTAVVAAAMVTAAPPERAIAQDAAGAIFRGQVVDSISGDPIEGVMIRMDSGAEAFTNSRGRFELSGLPQGRRLYALLSSDCRITWGEIDVIVGIPRDERLELPQAFRAASDEARREEEERQRTGGKRYDAEEIDAMHVASATDLVRRVAPGMVGPLSGAPGQTSAITSSRSRSFVEADPPVLVVDGVRTPDAARVLHDLRASEVATLEVLPGASAGWEFGSAGASGVIKITLRRGYADGQAVGQRAAPCVVPSFPGDLPTP